MPLPLVGSKPYFYNIPNTPPAAYRVPVTSSSVVLVWPISTAVSQSLVSGNQVDATFQRTGTSPTGAFPLLTAYNAVLDQSRISYLQTKNEIWMEIRNLGQYPKNINLILRITLSDTSGQIRVLSVNLTTVFF